MEELQVMAEVQVIKSMSAHGDYEDLQRFADRLCDKGFKHIAIPSYHQEYELE